MSELPQPEDCWEEADKAKRKKGKTILWLGILFSAVTLGTVSRICRYTKSKVFHNFQMLLNQT